MTDVPKSGPPARSPQATYQVNFEGDVTKTWLPVD